MRTGDLIARLAADLTPVRSQAALRILARGAVAGALAAFVLTALTLGLRHDVLQAAQHWQYWAKFAYPLVLAVLAFRSVARLSRPGMRAAKQMLLEAVPLMAAALAAMAQWSSAADSEHAALLLGHSYLVCPWLIVLVSLPVFAGVIWSMRRLAPTRPVWAGAAAGVFSGAAGAWIYALHCDETSLVFVAVWYTAGIALMGALGALTGRRMLHW